MATNYSKQFKDARAALNITQQQLADRFRVHKNTVMRWEGGKSVPQVIYRRKLEALTNGEKLPRKTIRKTYRKSASAPSSAVRHPFTRGQLTKIIQKLLPDDGSGDQ